MRRLLMALGAALAIHGLLLATKPGWLEIPSPPEMEPRPVTLTLVAYQEQRPEKPVEKTPETVKETVVAVPEKQKVKPRHTPKPPQKEIARHRKKIPEPPKKAPSPKEKMPKPRKPPKTLAPAEVAMVPKAVLKLDQPPDPEPPLEQERPQDPIESYARAPDVKDGLLEDAGTGETRITVSRPKVPNVPEVRKATPIYKRTPPPPYPKLARKRGHEGTVILEVLVDREGNVGDLRLFRSSGYRILDKAAMESVRKWTFEPGMREEEKVEMWVRVPVRFELR